MAFKSIATVFLLLPILFLGRSAPQKPSTQIKPGSIISLDLKSQSQNYGSSWSSPSGHFEFGFHEHGKGFAVGIWLVGSDKKIVVWTANRDDPPITSNAKLILDQNGKLLLKTEDGDDGNWKEKLIANTRSQSATSASMLDSGNFVLYNHDSQIIWESFKYPTDTILGGQNLSRGSQLVSSTSETDHSTGRFHLEMQHDSNLVLYPTNTDSSSADAYWAGDTYGFEKKCYLYLNNTGTLSIMNGVTFEIESYLYDPSSDSDMKVNGKVVYRAKLEENGMFRLYSYVEDKNGKLKEPPVMVWKEPKDVCVVKGFCGLNSYCTFFDYLPNCLCLPGFDFIDLNEKTLGCLRNYSDAVCTNGKENTTIYEMVTMENLNWGGHVAYMQEQNMSLEECSNSCLEDCNCGAALFQKSVCKKQKLPLRYVRRDVEESITAFFKVGKSLTKTGNQTANSIQDTINGGQQVKNENFWVQILVLALSLVVFSCVSIAISCLYIFKIRVLRYKRLGDQMKGEFGGLMNHDELTMRVFSYNELKKATNGFKEELGRGAFGAVYRGALNKGRKLVAVKRLEKLVEEGEREFQAEMRAIGRTNHKNLVRLMGYCAEDSKRLLVYEYMSNGSLADLLFKQSRRPNWDERVRIAIDVAKGIRYLHEECKTPIIHCDVKPQNILMDDFWTAKICDFGLAKFLMPDQTRTFTGIRGTRGYLAPEWQKNTSITVKADVYSYGIVILEIICCRRNLEPNVPNAEEILLSNWVYNCFAARELDKLVVGEDVDRRTLENMVKVGLWCIQDEPILRPSMKSVVLMLEGITDIASPPCPTSASM